MKGFFNELKGMGRDLGDEVHSIGQDLSGLYWKGHNALNSGLDHIYDHLFSFKSLGLLAAGGLAIARPDLAVPIIGGTAALYGAHKLGLTKGLIKGGGKLMGGAAAFAGKTAFRAAFPRGVAHGAAGLGLGLGSFAINAAQSAWSGAKGIEKIARIGLANGKWFPNVGNTSMDIIARMSPNLSIGRRLMGLGMIAGFGAMVGEAISPKAPPPTLYFDGLNMRHVNDMGANASYGQNVLGRNSTMNTIGTRAGVVGLNVADDMAFAALRSVRM